MQLLCDSALKRKQNLTSPCGQSQQAVKLVPRALFRSGALGTSSIKLCHLTFPAAAPEIVNQRVPFLHFRLWPSTAKWPRNQQTRLSPQVRAQVTRMEATAGRLVSKGRPSRLHQSVTTPGASQPRAWPPLTSLTSPRAPLRPEHAIFFRHERSSLPRVARACGYTCLREHSEETEM